MYSGIESLPCRDIEEAKKLDDQLFEGKQINKVYLKIQRKAIV